MMKALIFNSGIGKRLGEWTTHSHKSMLTLLNGETIFERQIRILSECGIKEFVITTGPFEEQLIEISKKKCYTHLTFNFVHSDLYDKSNYIYSFYLARKHLNDDFLLLHGDLVFNKNLVLALLNDSRCSLGLVNKNIPLPKKDFKARVINGKLMEVGVNIFDENCYAFQPLYKLSKTDLDIWKNAVIDFIKNKKEYNVYAENALNFVSNQMNIELMDYDDFYINEIDDLADYERVSKEIRLFDYKEQEILYGLDKLYEYLNRYNLKKPLVVIASFLKDSIYVEKLKNEYHPVFFSDFRPNPTYEEVLEGLKTFKTSDCDCIISLGGGSAIDVSKAIKLFLPLNPRENYLNQKHIYVNLKHISIPTTAGTGSESTRYSVIYYQGIKQTLTDDNIIPDVAILDKDFLKTLPLTQKKATTFDALCHAIESMWSINSTVESRTISKKAIEIILKNIDAYFDGDENVLESMLEASNLAGKAINLTQTTAAHALSYKLTSLYKIPHGHAVALCIPKVWKKLYEKKDQTIDSRGVDHINNVLQILNRLFSCGSTIDTISRFENMLTKYKMDDLLDIKNNELTTLVESVNLIRLKNYPIKLTTDDISEIYLSLKR